MKILFVGVFNIESTNYSQAKLLEELGHKVFRYEYRTRGNHLGSTNRDNELIKTCKKLNPDLMLISKGNGIDTRVIIDCNNITTTGLWYMDPVNQYWNKELKEKIKYCSFSCCAKAKAVELGKELNPNIYRVIEGFDPEVDKPFDLDNKYDVSFIGNIHTSDNRKNILNNLDINIFNNKYREEHAITVSQSKININISTNNCESDRVYKILAAKGFLLSDTWDGINDTLIPDKDLVIYNDIDDLKDKIVYYLNNDEAREKIRTSGYNTVQKFSRINWGKNILGIYERLKNVR